MVGGFELLILLPLPLRCWDYRSVLSTHLIGILLVFETGSCCVAQAGFKLKTSLCLGGARLQSSTTASGVFIYKPLFIEVFFALILLETFLSSNYLRLLKALFSVHSFELLCIFFVILRISIFIHKRNFYSF